MKKTLYDDSHFNTLTNQVQSIITLHGLLRKKKELTMFTMIDFHHFLMHSGFSEMNVLWHSAFIRVFFSAH